MLKRWNVILLSLTFLLTIVGTWMTRSQIIVSIHAFADSELSDYFLVYMIVIALFATWLIARRWGALRSEARIESFMSREAMFVLNNVVLVFCFVVTLWGTLMPKFTSFMEHPIMWTEDDFNLVFVWIGLALLVLLGIGPLISWRKATARNFQKNFMWPLAWGSLATLAGAILVIVLESLANARVHGISFGEGFGIWAGGLDAGDWMSIIVYWLCAFVIFSIVREFHVAARVRKAQGLGGYWGNWLVVMFKNPRRYGGYVVHAGVVFMFFAFTGKAFKHEEKDRLMAVGDTHIVDRYALSLVDRNSFYSKEEGCAISDATFVAMPLRSTVAESSVQRLTQWLGDRKTGPFHVTTTLDEPFMQVRVKDPAARRALVADYFLARHFKRDFRREDAARTELGQTWVFKDRRLLQSPMTQGGAMQKLRAARDALTAAALTGVHVELTPGLAELRLRFSDKASQEAFDQRVGAAAVPDWVLALSDDEESGAVAVVDRRTGDVLVPESRFYESKSTSTTEVAISGEDFLVDLYVSMQPDMGRPYVKVFTVVFPLVNFLWIGGLLLLVGSLICLTPRWLSRAMTSLVSGRPIRSEAPEHAGGMEPAAARVAEVEPAARGSIGRTVAMIVVALVGAAFFVSAARAAERKAEPFGFSPPRGDPGADLWQALDCACPQPPGTLRPPALGDAACACPEAERDRAVAVDLLSMKAPADIASGRAKYLVLAELIAVDPVWETRIRYEPAELERLLKTIRTTCPGEYLMTLEATRATCSHRMRWVREFRHLLAAGVSEEDVFAFYLADNNANQPGGPWQAYELRASEETVLSFWVPASAVAGVLALVLVVILRNRRRARDRAAAPTDVGPEVEREREARVDTALAARERERLRDELEAFDA